MGDPHAKVSNLVEMEALMHFTNEMMLEHKVDRLEILGDLFHNHAQIRLEVLEFWDAWIDVFTAHEDKQIVILVGNHDQSGDYADSAHALSVFHRIRKKNLHIVDSPRRMGVIGYLPYVHDINKWLEYARNLHSDGAKALVSHTTYQGSKYESGMYAPDGVDPELVPFDLLISGHIHSRQRFVTSRGQSVIYPGTSRWDTASDSNEPKGLWLVDHDDLTGSILREEFLDTSGVVTPIRSYEWAEGAPAPELDPRAKSHVELIGSSAWITKTKEELRGKCALSSTVTDRVKNVARKAESNLGSFVDTWQGITPGVDREKLKKYMKELKLV